MSDILALDATDQLKALEARTISARELLELSTARSRAVHERLNAVVNSDLETAREVAGLVDDARARGETLGVLAGLPMTIKDSFDVEGMAASSGVAAFTGREAKDAVMIARAKAAGAVIWGKTNVPVMTGDWQTYNRLYGTTNNPWDLERGPGGSSGGSAAMLAAQVTALEIGSDIAGSLRTPAAFCGVCAHNPTYGLLPKTGHVPPKPGTHAESDLSVVGPMARTTRDLTLLLHVLSKGATPQTPASLDIKSLKIGLWLDDPALILDAQVRAVLDAYVADAEATGFSITPIESPVEGEALLETYNMLLMSQLAAGFPENARKRLARQRPGAAARRRMGSGPLSHSATILASTASHRDWLLAHEVRCKMQAQMAGAFEQFDVILSPVTPIEPFFHDHSAFNHRKLRCSNGLKIPYNSMMMWVALATTCGLPATAIPAGFSAAGLPVGIQVIGPRGRDAHTLDVAHALEQAVGGYVAPDLGV